MLLFVVNFFSSIATTSCRDLQDHSRPGALFIMISLSHIIWKYKISFHRYTDNTQLHFPLVTKAFQWMLEDIKGCMANDFLHDAIHFVTAKSTKSNF